MGFSRSGDWLKNPSFGKISRICFPKPMVLCQKRVVEILGKKRLGFRKIIEEPDAIRPRY
ncbi:MAG: hypothetical protein DWI28_04970 [Planctomycetota bacterium]|nr:MAG: hypothetical protein DWI28_04970 [Planctomycetota bacterium]